MRQIVRFATILLCAAVVVQSAGFGISQHASARELAPSEAADIWGGTAGSPACSWVGLKPNSWGCTLPGCQPIANGCGPGTTWGYCVAWTCFYTQNGQQFSCGPVTVIYPCTQ